jgi:hypothetical protein
MKISFLGQGIESASKNAVGHFLVKYLNEKNFNGYSGSNCTPDSGANCTVISGIIY